MCDISKVDFNIQKSTLLMSKQWLDIIMTAKMLVVKIKTSMRKCTDSHKKSFSPPCESVTFAPWKIREK